VSKTGRATYRQTAEALECTRRSVQKDASHLDVLPVCDAHLRQLRGVDVLQLLTINKILHETHLKKREKGIVGGG
jgi:hypothetical protein